MNPREILDTARHALNRQEGLESTIQPSLSLIHEPYCPEGRSGYSAGA